MSIELEQKLLQAVVKVRDLDCRPAKVDPDEVVVPFRAPDDAAAGARDEQ